MYHSRHETLVNRGSSLFSDKSSLNSLHQEIADHFYPERADFTRSRYLGTDFASNLTSSYPLIVRRELGNAISSILRPAELEWFEVTVDEDDKLDKAGKEWLEYATTVQRRAMYDRVTQFVRATKEGDHDFATFGQCVISIEYAPKNIALLYRTWHLRDCAWTEKYDGSVGELHIKWEPKARELKEWFGEESMSTAAKRCLDKEPEKRIKCRRVIIEAEGYERPEGAWKHPWVHVFIDVENKHVMAERNVPTRGYIIPRWQTVSGSQYAYSPATVAGLPDARLIQAMTLTLLEAGEMAVRPPLIAPHDFVREDFQIFAGGVTYIDAQDMDKRRQETVRELYQGRNGMPYGFEMAADVRSLLSSAFYLNKLTLPQADREMTAYETAERIKEYIRHARPLFEPMEHEYNYELCDGTFTELLNRGAFGSMQEIPDSVLGRETRYRFESPLSEAVERQKGVTFLEAKSLLREAAELDSGAVVSFDATKALREALKGVRVPERWMRSEDAVREIIEERAAQQQMREQIEAAGAGGAAAEQLARASEALG